MIQDWNDPKYCLEAVKQNGLVLRWVENQTPDICLEAVKEDGYALRFVKEQTPEICLQAVKQYGLALEYVKEQTHEICLEAVKEDGLALKYVINQTPLIIHYLKKYNIVIYKSYKKENRITIPDNEMVEFYNENPHLLLTL